MVSSSSSTATSSMSSSKSYSSSPSLPFSPSTHLPSTPTRLFTPKTIEEVWKDINLPNTPSILRPHYTQNPSNSRNTIFQDFLARPFSVDPPSATAASDSYGVYSSRVPPLSTTSLNLNSDPDTEFPFLDNSVTVRPYCHSLSSHTINASALNGPIDSLERKRMSGSDSNKSTSKDLRHKRMIKNRESAARSRARKQAYANELELEVARLREENARLKRQQEELRRASVALLSKKHTLHRASTATF